MSAKRGGLGTNLDSLIPTSLTVAGTEVAQQNEVSIDLINQPVGNYLVKITNSSNATKTVKIINQ